MPYFALPVARWFHKTHVRPTPDMKRAVITFAVRLFLSSSVFALKPLKSSGGALESPDPTSFSATSNPVSLENRTTRLKRCDAS